MNAELLTATDVARLAGVAPSTVRYWSDSGRLPVLRTAGGVRLFRRGLTIRFLEQRAQKLSVSTELATTPASDASAREGSRA